MEVIGVRKRSLWRGILSAPQQCASNKDRWLPEANRDTYC
jgi:hypothetical protein